MTTCSFCPLTENLIPASDCARACEAGFTYHVLNRGNARSEVFHKPADYAAFLQVICEATIRVPMPMLAYCLMPNHFHLVVRPHGDRDLSRWMHWLLTTHVRRYLKYYSHTGHVWQGRFKAFAAQDDDHLITVGRYVERNPVRAGLVTRAEDWPWSSFGAPFSSSVIPPRVTTDELLRRANWIDFVNCQATLKLTPLATLKLTPAYTLD